MGSRFHPHPLAPPPHRQYAPLPRKRVTAVEFSVPRVGKLPSQTPRDMSAISSTPATSSANHNGWDSMLATGIAAPVPLPLSDMHGTHCVPSAEALALPLRWHASQVERLTMESSHESWTLAAGSTGRKTSSQASSGPFKFSGGYYCKLPPLLQDSHPYRLGAGRNTVTLPSLSELKLLEHPLIVHTHNTLNPLHPPPFVVPSNPHTPSSTPSGRTKSVKKTRETRRRPVKAPYILSQQSLQPSSPGPPVLAQKAETQVNNKSATVYKLCRCYISQHTAEPPVVTFPLRNPRKCQCGTANKKL